MLNDFTREPENLISCLQRPRGQKNERLMISTDECKKVLNSTNHQYTDEQILLIRDFMYQLAQLELLTI